MKNELFVLVATRRISLILEVDKKSKVIDHSQVLQFTSCMCSDLTWSRWVRIPPMSGLFLFPC